MNSFNVAMRIVCDRVDALPAAVAAFGDKGRVTTARTGLAGDRSIRSVACELAILVLLLHSIGTNANCRSRPQPFAARRVTLPQRNLIRASFIFLARLNQNWRLTTIFVVVPWALGRSFARPLPTRSRALRPIRHFVRAIRIRVARLGEDPRALLWTACANATLAYGPPQSLTP